MLKLEKEAQKRLANFQNLWYGIRQETVKLLMGTVSNSTPACRIEVLPDSAQTYGHPLPEERMRVIELLQTNRNQVPLQTCLLNEKQTEIHLY